MFKWLSNRYKLSFESHYNFRFFRSVRNKKNQYISFFLGITFRFSDYTHQVMGLCLLQFLQNLPLLSFVQGMSGLRDPVCFCHKHPRDISDYHKYMIAWHPLHRETAEWSHALNTFHPDCCLSPDYAPYSRLRYTTRLSYMILNNRLAII